MPEEHPAGARLGPKRSDRASAALRSPAPQSSRADEERRPPEGSGLPWAQECGWWIFHRQEVPAKKSAGTRRSTGRWSVPRLCPPGEFGPCRTSLVDRWIQPAGQQPAGSAVVSAEGGSRNAVNSPKVRQNGRRDRPRTPTRQYSPVRSACNGLSPGTANSTGDQYIRITPNALDVQLPSPPHRCPLTAAKTVKSTGWILAKQASAGVSQNSPVLRTGRTAGRAVGAVSDQK